MNRFAFATLLLLPLTLAASQSKENPCWKKAVAQSELNSCAAQDSSAADAELNRVYKDLLLKNKGDDNATKKLKDAQRAWIAFRDAELEALYPAQDKQREYGSIYPMCYAMVASAMTKERTAQLRRILQDKDPCDIGD
ncbi:MAG: lysozyme inhibitor LprI family protein [Candidatus Sulfotelmatobacter sp.]